MHTLIADADLRERLGRAGREHALQFTAESLLPRYEEFYRRLLSGEAGR